MIEVDHSSMCGSWTLIIKITWKLFRNENFLVLPRYTESEIGVTSIDM
jgi:hypothetical protein